MYAPLPPEAMVKQLMRSYVSGKGQLGDDGLSSKVFIVDGKALAKLNFLKRNVHEYFLAKWINSVGGINVPIMHGVFPCRASSAALGMPGDDNLDSYLFMQRLHGAYVNKVERKYMKSIVSQYRGAVKRMVELRVYPGDIGGPNMIYVKRNDRLYFIDFEYWARGKKSSEELRETLDRHIKHPEEVLF